MEKAKESNHIKARFFLLDKVKKYFDFRMMSFRYQSIKIKKNCVAAIETNTDTSKPIAFFKESEFEFTEKNNPDIKSLYKIKKCLDTDSYYLDIDLFKKSNSEKKMDYDKNIFENHTFIYVKALRKNHGLIQKGGEVKKNTILKLGNLYFKCLYIGKLKRFFKKFVQSHPENKLILHQNNVISSKIEKNQIKYNFNKKTLEKQFSSDARILVLLLKNIDNEEFNTIFIVPLNISKILIGRDKDSHICINGKYVSKNHAYLKFDIEKKSLRIFDNESRYGTYVNIIPDNDSKFYLKKNIFLLKKEKYCVYIKLETEN